MKLYVTLLLLVELVALQLVQAAPMSSRRDGKAPVGEGSQESFNAFKKEDFKKVDPVKAMNNMGQKVLDQSVEVNRLKATKGKDHPETKAAEDQLEILSAALRTMTSNKPS